MSIRIYIALVLAALCVLLIPVAWFAPTPAAMMITGFQLSCVGINAWLCWGPLREARRDLREARRERDRWRRLG